MSENPKTGIFLVSNIYTEEWARRCLPPEHKIIATRVKPGEHYTEYLVEGPLMPGDNAVIHLLCTIHATEDNGIKLTGSIDDHVWEIGSWSSIEAFVADRQKLMTE
jgi:hypothetical protein